MIDLIENLSIINNQLEIINKKTEETKNDIIENYKLIENYEKMDNEVKNISSHIDAESMKCKTPLNPYIILIVIIISIIILHIICNEL